MVRSRASAPGPVCAPCVGPFFDKRCAPIGVKVAVPHAHGCEWGPRRKFRSNIWRHRSCRHTGPPASGSDGNEAVAAEVPRPPLSQQQSADVHGHEAIQRMASQLSGDANARTRSCGAQGPAQGSFAFPGTQPAPKPLADSHGGNPFAFAPPALQGDFSFSFPTPPLVLGALSSGAHPAAGGRGPGWASSGGSSWGDSSMGGVLGIGGGGGGSRTLPTPWLDRTGVTSTFDQVTMARISHVRGGAGSRPQSPSHASAQCLLLALRSAFV